MPTYNEANNIARVLDKIHEHIKNDMPNHLTNVLVVDDNSPDGSAEIVKTYQRDHPFVYLLNRNAKQGLGSAYISGFKCALANLQPDVIIEMDADLSHDPSKLKSLVSGIEKGADFVIGSRYVEGGTVPKQWGWHRKLISRGSSYATRMLLGANVRDGAGGYRAIRSEYLRKLDLDRLNVKGYAFQAVILYHVVSLGGKVIEIPIDFVDRESGESKMQVKDMVEGFWVLLRERVKHKPMKVAS